MSLQVWLPLNGNLNNQGLSDAEIIATGATVNTSGKIGSCYSFDGSDDLISINCPDLYKTFSGGSQQFSVAFWVYHADSTRAIIFGDYSLAGTIGFNIELTTGHQIRFYWNGSPDKNFAAAAAVAASDWTHIVLTYDGSKLNIYKNGILQSDSWSGTLATKNKTSGLFYLGRDSRTGTTVLNGRLNDFRIYNHALSIKEVEEISKGLVLHYKIDGFTNITNPNLIKDSAPTTQNWSSAGSNWANSLVECSLSPSGYAIRCSYSGTTQTSGGMHKGMYDINLIENGATYTLSGWIRASKNCKVSFWNEWMTGVSQTNITTEWKYYKITGVMDTSRTYKSDVCYMVASYVEENVWIEAFGFKLEKGSDATPWIPHTTDALYAGYSQDLNIVYDSSGYGNNGTITGTITTLSDTPRYIRSSYFNGSSYVLTPAGTFNWWDFNKGTVCAWMKPTATASGWSGSVGIAGDNNQNSKAFGITFYANSFRSVYCNTAYTTISTGKSMPVNEWHFCCATIDGTIVKSYFDGILVNTTTIDWKTATVPTNLRFQVGVDIPGTDEKFTGNYSDIRFYSSVLTDEQILELYNTSSTIDKDGNVYAREVQEI